MAGLDVVTKRMWRVQFMVPVVATLLVAAWSTNVGAIRCKPPKKAYAGKCRYDTEIRRLKDRAKAQKAQVTVKSRQEGAAVFFNGENVGSTPWTSALLKPGRFMIEVVRPNHRKIGQWVELKKGDRIEVELNPEAMKGKLILTAKNADGRPIRADVYSGDKKIGRTRLERNMNIGDYSLTVKDAGGKYFQRIVRVSIKDGQEVRSDVVLKAKTARRPTGGDTKISDVGTEKERDVYSGKGRFFFSANVGVGFFFLSEDVEGVEQASTALSIVGDVRLGFGFKERLAIFLVGHVAPTLTQASVMTGTSTVDLPPQAEGHLPFFVGIGLGLVGEERLLLAASVGLMGLVWSNVPGIEHLGNTYASEAAYQACKDSEACGGIGSSDEMERGDATKLGFGSLFDLVYTLKPFGDFTFGLGLQVSVGYLTTSLWTGEDTGERSVDNTFGTGALTLNLTGF